MRVLYSLTRDYYRHLHWSLDSLLKHNEVEKVYIFAQDAEIPVDIPCSHQVFNLSQQTFIPHGSPNWNTPYTPMSLMRVLAPELCFTKKVLYLDVDTIICDDLTPLWETDIDGKWFGWVREARGHYRPYGRDYFNAGVVLMNLSQMRRDDAVRQMLFLLNTQKFKYGEQDVMNMLADPTKYVEVDRRWNESFCTDFSKNPSIVHYAGSRDWYENKTDLFRWEYREESKK